MSKIQKALNALRGSEDFAAATQQELKTRQADNSPRLNPKAAELSATGRMPALEPVPSKSINIDEETLIAAGLIPSEDDKPTIADQFRRIKRPVLQCAFGDDLSVGVNANVIMVASALPGAGKTFCSTNLAQSIAVERDFGSVLVDADVLKPSVSRSFGLQDEIGLIDYLIDSSISLEDILIATDYHGVIVLPAGRRHPEATELLASRRMRELISELSQRFSRRAIVFDTPPLLITNEAQVLAQKAGQIVLVIEARVSSQEAVARALGMLDRDKPINAILNKSRSAGVTGYHSDDYGYYPQSRRPEDA